MNLRICVRSFVALTSLAVACEKPRPPMNAEELRLAQKLAGSWDMRFKLTQSPSLAVDSARAPREIDGKLDLLVNTSLNRSFAGVGIPTNYGSYDVDLTKFGFDPRIAGMPPAAIAGMVSRDSVAILLSPESDTEEMLLVGRLEDGTLSGTWHIVLERSAGYGLFVLKRPPPR